MPSLEGTGLVVQVVLGRVVHVSLLLAELVTKVLAGEMSFVGSYINENQRSALQRRVESVQAMGWKITPSPPAFNVSFSSLYCVQLHDVPLLNTIRFPFVFSNSV